MLLKWKSLEKYTCSAKLLHAVLRASLYYVGPTLGRPWCGASLWFRQKASAKVGRSGNLMEHRAAEPTAEPTSCTAPEVQRGSTRCTAKFSKAAPAESLGHLLCLRNKKLRIWQNFISKHIQRSPCKVNEEMLHWHPGPPCQTSKTVFL